MSALPRFATAADAGLGIEMLLEHPDLEPLLEWFRPAGGLNDIVAHVRSIAAEADAAVRSQTDAIASNLAALSASPSPATDDRLRDVISVMRAWDFRLGRERDAIPRIPDLLPPAVGETALRFARALELLDAPSVNGEFDAVIPIGGLVRANIGRPAAVAAWHRSGQLITKLVVGMASDRTTSLGERACAKAHGVPSETEQDALRYGLEQAFGLHPDGWTVRTAGFEEHPGSIVPIGLATVPPIGGRRANTEEGLRWLLGTDVLAGATSVLQVTTPIYWIANQISARCALPPSVAVQTVGYPMVLPGWDPLVFHPQHYLQEIKAAFEALPRLRAWAAEVR